MNKDFQISVDVSPDYDNWKQTWSIREFGEELKRLASESKTISKTIRPLSRGFYTGYNLEIPIPDLSSTVEIIIDLVSKAVSHDLIKASDSLNESTFKNSVVKSFNFPEEIKVSCEQYLLYFVQFLKDLGVEANARIGSGSV